MKLVHVTASMALTLHVNQETKQFFHYFSPHRNKFLSLLLMRTRNSRYQGRIDAIALKTAVMEHAVMSLW